MDSKKKILLGSTDILAKDNEDLFLNINLNSTYSNIRNDKYENIFDVEAQFKKERNSSRDFRIYGLIDSTVTDCDNLQIEVYSSSASTGLTNLIHITGSTNLVYDGLNVYGKKKGKFIVNLENYESDFVFLKIPSNNQTFKDQVYSQQVVFKDSEGKFVDYGTKTIDIGDDGNAIEINNDFYFLYNKHWIKKDLLIIEEKPAKVFFNASNSDVLTNEFTSNLDIVEIDVSLDKPSSFGIEKVDISVLSSSLDSNEIIIVDSSNNILTLPHTISFNVGEQNKLLYFYSPSDYIQEFLEDVSLGLDNFKYVNAGSTLEKKILVADTTPRNKVIVNFQSVYQNRNYFTARVFDNIALALDQSFPMPAVLRNGLFFEGTPMEFYPSDNYTLKIKNVGLNTILPVNNKLGISNERLFLSNEELSFNIKQEYTNIEKHAITLTFKEFDSTSISFNYYSLDSGLMINGIPLVKYGYTFIISYTSCLAYLTQNIPSSLMSKIDGWSYGGLECPFDVVTDIANLTITLVAKNPGTRLDLSSYGSIPDLFSLSYDDFYTLGIKADLVEPFVLGDQIPLKFELSANMGNNLFAQYKFTISKPGFDTMSFTNSPIAASIIPSNYYLASGLNTILRNWDDSTSTAVYKHEHVTSDWGNNAYSSNPSYGFYKKGDVYINGMVILSNQYLSRTGYYCSDPVGAPALNISHAINSSADFSHDLLASPISIIPETNSTLSLFDVSQYGYLTILKPNYGLYLTPPADVSSDRGFDFRTGGTGPYNSYKIISYNNYGGFYWNSNPGIESTGNTIASTNSNTTQTLKVFFETGKPSPLITPQGIQGVGAPLPSNYYSEYTNIFSAFNHMPQNVDGQNALSVIRLESQTPGNPFEFNNFREMKYVSGANIGTNYTENSIFYIEARPNQKAGVTINLANNHMGGFSVTHP